MVYGTSTVNTWKQLESCLFFNTNATLKQVNGTTKKKKFHRNFCDKNELQEWQSMRNVNYNMPTNKSIPFMNICMYCECVRVYLCSNEFEHVCVVCIIVLLLHSIALTRWVQLWDAKPRSLNEHFLIYNMYKMRGRTMSRYREKKISMKQSNKSN